MEFAVLKTFTNMDGVKYINSMTDNSIYTCTDWQPRFSKNLYFGNSGMLLKGKGKLVKVQILISFHYREK